MECPYCFKKFKLKSRFTTHVEQKICFRYFNKEQKEKVLKQFEEKPVEKTEEILPEDEPIVAEEDTPNPLEEQLERLKNENFELIKKINESQARDVKVRKTDRQKGELIKEMVISILLNSPLNISEIPDEIEEQIYLSIINSLIDYASTSCSGWSLFKRK